MKKLFRILWVVALLAPVASWAEDPAPATPPKVTELQRLVAASGTEPLVALGVEDIRTLPEHFAATHLYQMLTDKAYEGGLVTIKQLLNDATGANLAQLLPKAAKLMSGPALVAVVPDGDTLSLTFFAVTPNADAARELATIWPKPPDDPAAGIATAYLQLIKLKTFLPAELPAADAALPDWARNLPAGDLTLVVQPRKFAKTAEKAIVDGKVPGIAPNTPLIPLLADIDDAMIEAVRMGIAIDGDEFNENLAVDISSERDTTLMHVALAMREKPKGWDSLLAAMPSDGEAAVMAQTDPKALGPDLPYAVQALERYLRGRRWAKKQGVAPEALDATRFDFLFEKLHGEFGISARPALTEVHLVVSAAMKAADLDTLRTNLVQGLGGLDAGFDTLASAPKIGNNAPLGAQFQGRGIFSAPVIGMSPGWTWLCTNLKSYQELIAAFGSGKTMAAAIKTENERLKAGGLPGLWRPDDALRIQINLEKMIQVGYTVWLLSGEQPVIGGWQVPAAMLPPPQLFSGHLGMLRVGLGRSGKSLAAYSRGSIPGVSLLAVGLLQGLATAIDDGREFAKNPPPPPPERTAIKKKKSADDPPSGMDAPKKD